MWLVLVVLMMLMELMLVVLLEFAVVNCVNGAGVRGGGYSDIPNGNGN